MPEPWTLLSGPLLLSPEFKKKGPRKLDHRSTGKKPTDPPVVSTKPDKYLAEEPQVAGTSRPAVKRPGAVSRVPDSSAAPLLAGFESTAAPARASYHTKSTRPGFLKLAIPESDDPRPVPKLVGSGKQSSKKDPIHQRAVLIESKVASLPASWDSPAQSQSSKAHSDLTEPVNYFRLVYSIGDRVLEDVAIKRKKIEVDRLFMDERNAEVREKKWRVLMLYPGQGGTFAFGDWYINEKEERVEVKKPADLSLTLSQRIDVQGERLWRRREDRVKHLMYYAPSVDLIGTKDCGKCIQGLGIKLARDTTCNPPRLG